MLRLKVFYIDYHYNIIVLLHLHFIFIIYFTVIPEILSLLTHGTPVLRFVLITGLSKSLFLISNAKCFIEKLLVNQNLQFLIKFFSSSETCLLIKIFFLYLYSKTLFSILHHQQSRLECYPIYLSNL